MEKGKRSRIIQPIIIMIMVILLWELLISNGENVEFINWKIEQLTGWVPGFESLVETLLPRPSKIISTLIYTPISGRGGVEYFWRHTKITLYGAALGFFFGNLLAILTATSFLYLKTLERIIMPIALALRSMPLVALTPLLLRMRYVLADLQIVQNNKLLYAIFGNELGTKIIIVMLIVYFPTLVNATRGLKSVSTQALELMHTLCASQWQVYWKLRMPTALPLIFSALKVATSSSVLGIIVAEWLSSAEGLGYVIYRSYGESQIPRMMMAMIIACVFSILLFVLLGVLQKRLIPWDNSVKEVDVISNS